LIRSGWPKNIDSIIGWAKNQGSTTLNQNIDLKQSKIKTKKTQKSQKILAETDQTPRKTKNMKNYEKHSNSNPVTWTSN
jgi:hypothetical protein